VTDSPIPYPHQIAYDLNGELFGITQQVYMLHLLAKSLPHKQDRNALAQVAFQLEERLGRVESLSGDGWSSWMQNVLVLEKQMAPGTRICIANSAYRRLKGRR